MNDRLPTPGPGVEDVLQHLEEARGSDFTGYERAGLIRRVRHRMSELGIGDHAGYVEHLRADAGEVSALVDAVPADVPGFLRDPEAWTSLREQGVPAILAERGPHDPIRVWSAGCASGEEAYSLAIAFAEVVGIEQFRQRVKIYATDVDDEALAKARLASYGERELRGVPPELIARYFERQNGHHRFRKDLRRSIVFGRNDLEQDAPISRLDLLVCRNTLTYLDQRTRSEVLGRFHFALAPGGVLFLGKAEALPHHSPVFDPLDHERRLFRKAPTGSPPARSPSEVVHHRGVNVGGIDALEEQAFSSSPVAQVVVTADGVVALVNGQAETLFEVSAEDVGQPLRDLELSYRPIELRGYVEQARLERKSLRVKDVEWLRNTGGALWLEVHVDPLIGADDTVIGVAVAFHDVTAARKLVEELAFTKRQLEAAYGELQSTNEETETTNEELQSTVEELETTSEEFQSTNEELETMNEELHSTNDELQTINDVLRERSSELDRVNGFLESVLTSLRAGVVVLDPQLRVLAWNRGAEDLWGLRREEAEGEHLLNLDIGLPVADLRPVVRPALSDPAFSGEVELTAVNRRGRTVLVRVVCTPLRRGGGGPAGAILVMEQRRG
ncbi:CheR family methyltransferase [Lentzea albida]|uniref:Two-component system, chemotaxis family, CheB/CheR fusion protein n=1 Tax=Lentzea albida TaxID=65499 RepID=A0A1H9WFT1_9PSEU|nr:CheR family methyltransferase [Lentzea albida]SES32333.1 two-component system, chemotaxis family, CheB/CheR fusion protein [Lentzea albida]